MPNSGGSVAAISPRPRPRSRSRPSPRYAPAPTPRHRHGGACSNDRPSSQDRQPQPQPFAGRRQQWCRAAVSARDHHQSKFNKVAVVAVLDGCILIVKDAKYHEVSIVTGGIKILEDAKPFDDIDSTSGRWGRSGPSRSYLGGENQLLIGAAREAAVRELDEETHGVIRGISSDEVTVMPTPGNVKHAPDPNRGQMHPVVGQYYVAVVDLTPWAARRGLLGACRTTNIIDEINAAKAQADANADAKDTGENIERWWFELANDVLAAGDGRRLPQCNLSMWKSLHRIIDNAAPAVRRVAVLPLPHAA